MVGRRAGARRRLLAGVTVEAAPSRAPVHTANPPRLMRSHDPAPSRQPQLRAVAGARLAEPRERLCQRAGVVGRRHVAVCRRLPASQAEVVRLPLELCVPEVGDVQSRHAAQHVQQVRDVLRDQLLLQVDGVRGDDDADVVAQREEHRGQQVGDGLADAGAALHEQVVRLGVRVRRAERPRDGLRHLGLLTPRLVAAEALRERAVVRQQLAHLVRRHRFRGLGHAEAARTLQPPRDLLRIDAADGPRVGCGRRLGEREHEVGERAVRPRQQVGEASQQPGPQPARTLDELKVDGVGEPGV